MLLTQRRFQQFQWRSGAAALQAYCLHESGKDQAGILNGGKRDETDAVREVTLNLSRDLERQARLTHASSAGEGKEAHLWARKQGTGCSDLSLPPNE